MSHRLTADQSDRLDRWLRRSFPDAPRREIDRLIAGGSVRVDGKRAAKGVRLRVGQLVELDQLPATREQMAPVPESGPIEVIYRDQALLAVNKIAGMATHPLDPGEGGTAANLVAHLAPECTQAGDQPREGGVTHRLDNGTSGALVFARTRDAYQAVRAQFGARQVGKTYLALTRGTPDSTPIDLPLEQRGRRSVVSDAGLEAITTWRELGSSRGFHLLECQTRTGRRHQVRAHLAAAGAAIVGDELYGGEAGPAQLEGFFLHARKLVLESPAAGEITIVAGLPEDRRQTLELCQLDVE